MSQTVVESLCVSWNRFNFHIACILSSHTSSRPWYNPFANRCRCKKSLFWQFSRVANYYVSILVGGLLVHLTIGPLPHVHDSISELLQQWKSSLNLKAFLLNSKMFWENCWSSILVRVSARFELATVRVNGSQLYVTIIQ